MNDKLYAYTKKVSYSFEDAVENLTESLKINGFGIISTIDISQKIKEKTGKKIPKYIILGACNPHLAFNALEAETEIGLLLPCNVIVYESKNEVFISAIVPSVAMSFIKNPKLDCVVNEVEPKLKLAIDNC